MKIIDTLKSAKNEFVAHPGYYLFDAALRIALAVAVGAAVYYGTAAALSYFAPKLAASAFGLKVLSFLPKALPAISALFGVLGATAISNFVLVKLFGEKKVNTVTLPEQESGMPIIGIENKGGLLTYFGMDKRYPLTAKQLETKVHSAVQEKFKDEAADMKINNLSKEEIVKAITCHYTKICVENGANGFGPTEKAVVANTPYTEEEVKFKNLPKNA